MINMFMSFDNIHYVQDKDGQIVLDEKPRLSWDYNHIRYYNVEKIFGLIDGVDIPLSSEQCIELDNFITQKRLETGILKPCVDSEGNYLGIINIDREEVHEVIMQSPPTQDDWIWDFDQGIWRRQYFYTAEKAYTRKNDPFAVGFTFEPLPINMEFVYELDLENNKWNIKETSESLVKVKQKVSKDVIYALINTFNYTDENYKLIIDTLVGISDQENVKIPTIVALFNEILEANTVTSMLEISDIMPVLLRPTVQVDSSSENTSNTSSVTQPVDAEAEFPIM